MLIEHRMQDGFRPARWDFVDGTMVINDFRSGGSRRRERVEGRSNPQSSIWQLVQRCPSLMRRPGEVWDIIFDAPTLARWSADSTHVISVEHLFAS